MTGTMVKQAEMSKSETLKKANESGCLEEQEESKEELKDFISEYLDYL